MKLINFKTILLALFLSWLVFSPVPEKEKSLQINSIGQTIVTTRGGSSDEPTQNLAKKKFFREMLKQYFPDWDERVNYQNKQVEFYKSGLRRISEAKRVKMPNSWKLIPQEADAFDYFRGTNFYKSHQNVKTPPNIYDTRRSFLLKMENEEMRDKFLETYNRVNSIE